METIFNVINPFFAGNQWQLNRNINTMFYRNKTDEFVITLLPSTGGIEVTVPLNKVCYKNTFYTLNTVVDYVKMHVNYYQTR
jgi:hypothetical protein